MVIGRSRTANSIKLYFALCYERGTPRPLAFGVNGPDGASVSEYFCFAM
jgi:hypothetical protein